MSLFRWVGARCSPPQQKAAKVALLCVALAQAIAGCGVVIPGDPCGADGNYPGTIILVNDVYYDGQSQTAFARVGDGVVERCREISGDIVVAGRVTHLDDFNNVETVHTIIVDEADLPDQIFRGTGANGDDVDCGIVGPFESLRTIEDTVRLYHGQQGCHVLAGFEKLQYVGGSLECGPNPEVGRALKHIGGWARCNSVGDRLQNLEYVGEIFGDMYLPNLKFAGRIQVEGKSSGAVVDLSSLEQVGPMPHWDCNQCEPGLFVRGNREVNEILIPRLTSVEGDLELTGNRGTYVTTNGYETMSGLLRSQIADVTITGHRKVCGNTSIDFRDDACAFEAECIGIYGPDSINCCVLDTWPQCIETYGEPDDDEA